MLMIWRCGMLHLLLHLQEGENKNVDPFLLPSWWWEVGPASQKPTQNLGRAPPRFACYKMHIMEPAREMIEL